MDWAGKIEREAARLTGTKRQPGSGALWWAKRDTREDPKFHTEVKGTRKRFFGVTPRLWNTLLKDALAKRKKPRLVVCLNPAPGLESWFQVTGHSEITRGFRVPSDELGVSYPYNQYEQGLRVQHILGNF